MTLTDHHIDELLRLCKNQDQKAQMEVYDRYYKVMYNTALRIVKDSAEAEDVMQDSFLSAFTKLDSFKGDATFGSWLKRIVVNNSITAYKKRQRLGESPLEDELYKLQEEPVQTECETDSFEVTKVMQALERLKENYRISLTLHLIEGFDYKEMSKILDLSYANCRTTVSRAKESLRREFESSW